jgi:hypothetical protein
MKHWVEAYAQDQDLFFTNYAKAHVALSELNAPNLLGELGNDIVEGGYLEKNTLFRFLRLYTSRDQEAKEELK